MEQWVELGQCQPAAKLVVVLHGSSTAGSRMSSSRAATPLRPPMQARKRGQLNAAFVAGAAAGGGDDDAGVYRVAAAVDAATGAGAGYDSDDAGACGSGWV